MCELARNSVLQSGWEMELKRHWLGPDFYQPGPRGNVVAKSNVPDIRLRFREETLREEQDLIWRFGHAESAQPELSPAAGAPESVTSPSAVAAAAVDSALDPTSFPGIHRVSDRAKVRRASEHEGREAALSALSSSKSAAEQEQQP